MINYFRSLFGLGGSSGKRTVLGHSVAIELKDVKYIQSSKERLDALYNLYSRFKNTTHAPRVKAVFDKSKIIHTYLVTRNRLHELEMFHLQHTDHFISAFTAILDSHQQKFEIPEAPAPVVESAAPSRESAMETLLNNFKAEKFKENWNGMSGRAETFKGQQTQKNVQTLEVEPGLVSLAVPTVSINTFEKTPYFPEGLPARAIGYTSSSQEKYEFQQHLIHKLGIENVKYMGNALVQFSDGNNSYSSNLVPIIHWKEFLYAVNLSEYRLFPVKTLRKGV